MFNFENSVTGNVLSEMLWELYCDVSCWSKWDSDIESVSLQGNFNTNDTGVIKMKSGQSLPFTLEEVNAPNSFTNVSRLGELTIRFGHFIKKNPDSTCTITHTVTIDGGETNQMKNMGKGITAHIPASMAQLLSLAI